MTHLDGNAIAGELTEIFAADLTTATATCVGCGKTGVVATAEVYGTRMGTVLRCPGCDSVLLRVVHARGEICLEMRGVSALRIAAR